MQMAHYVPWSITRINLCPLPQYLLKKILLVYQLEIAWWITMSFYLVLITSVKYTSQWFQLTEHSYFWMDTYSWKNVFSYTCFKAYFVNYGEENLFLNQTLLQTKQCQSHDIGVVCWIVSASIACIVWYLLNSSYVYPLVGIKCWIHNYTWQITCTYLLIPT